MTKTARRFGQSLNRRGTVLCKEVDYALFIL